MPADVHFSEAAAAFAAVEAIMSGKWDRYLLRLRGAVRQRYESEGYKAYTESIRSAAGPARGDG